jgi:hypothetical protein
VATPWGALYVPSSAILVEIDPTFEPDVSGYIIEFPKSNAKKAKSTYYTDRALTFNDVPVTMLAVDGTFVLGVIRYVSNDASLGQVRKNLDAQRARKKAARLLRH